MRLFVGLEIPRPIRLAMHERSARLRTSLPQASWVAAADYHLLLAFLGNTSEPAMGSVGAALSAAFGSHEGFDVQLAGAGASPPMRPARVLWIGVEDKAGLEGLHRIVPGIVVDPLRLVVLSVLLVSRRWRVRMVADLVGC